MQDGERLRRRRRGKESKDKHFFRGRHPHHPVTSLLRSCCQPFASSRSHALPVTTPSGGDRETSFPRCSPDPFPSVERRGTGGQTNCRNSCERERGSEAAAGVREEGGRQEEGKESRQVKQKLQSGKQEELLSHSPDISGNHLNPVQAHTPSLPLSCRQDPRLQRQHLHSCPVAGGAAVAQSSARGWPATRERGREGEGRRGAA